MNTCHEYVQTELPIENIEVSSDLQSRTELDDAVVEDYAERFSSESVSIPAVTVFYDGDKYWLADGFHRVAALKLIGKKNIGANVVKGNRRDALLHSLGANAEHGLPRTRADKRKAVLTALQDPEWGKWSNNEVAQICKVSRPFVAELRASLETFTSEKLYRTKHGTVSTMKTANIGRTTSWRATDSYDLGAPPPMSKEQETEQQIKELECQVLELAEENQKLRDAIAVGQFDGSDIEREDIEETIKDLREQLRVKEVENAALRESRDTYQNRAAELMKQVKSLQAKIRKAGI